MSSNVRTKLAGIIFLGLSGAGITAPAFAVNPFHYPDTVAHPDIRSWTDADGHHQHRSDHQLFNWGTDEGKYDAYAVWSNENFNYPRPKDTTSHGSHGFIEENAKSAPDFFFAGDWNLGDGAKAKSLVSEAFKTWSDITSDKSNLITGILFSETNKPADAEILVRWLTKGEYNGLTGNNPSCPFNNFIAFFCPSQRTGGGYDLVFKRDHDWFFDGTKADFLASTKKDDFFTVALHETGHIVGLDHQKDTDDIMEKLAGSKGRVKAGGAFRALSTDDTNGARDLYSVPCPAPQKAPAPKLHSLATNLATDQTSGGCADFGDAPDTYKTLLNSDGPFYREGELQKLGYLWDTEPNGQPTILANGDDLSILGKFAPVVDDEDGVIFGDSWVDVIFNITRPDPNPYQLRAWWDTNYNGIFDHTSELYIDDLLTLNPGIFTKRYNLGFNPKEDGLYSRFRLTWNPLDPDVKPFGEYYSKADCNTTDAEAGNCVSHGEVEDYVHVPEPSSLLSLLGLSALGAASALKRKQK